MPKIAIPYNVIVNLHVGCGDFRRTAVSVRIFHVGCSVYDAPIKIKLTQINRLAL